MNTPSNLKSLFKEHLAIKLNRVQQLFSQLELNNLIISSGSVDVYFADDMQVPFIASPFFREWLPLNKRQGCFLHIQASNNKPTLYLLNKEDIWHSAMQELPKGWEAMFDVRPYQDVSQLFDKGLLNSAGTAFLGPNNSFEIDNSRFNPQQVIDYLDYFRQYKSAYEQHCIRVANQLAMPCHLAAKDMFLNSGSELDVKRAFLHVANVSENDLPYPIISGINENAAVLHHHRLDNTKPNQHRSLLIDAGVEYYGYASDITRTYAFHSHPEFAHLINAVDTLQLQIVSEAQVGKTMAELNRLCHEKLTRLLIEQQFITSSFEQAMELGLSKRFLPHGLGHGVGVNVHERGATLASPDGQLCTRSEFGLEKKLVASEVITIEPGLYFIPGLLNKLKLENSVAINWSKVEQFMPFGGIRIEDNILINQTGEPENLTRI